MAETIRNARDRNYALRTIAERLAAADPPNPALINQALALAEIIPDDQDRGWALAGIAKRLAGADLETWR